MKPITDWVKAFDLEPHVEGGFYKQIHKDDVRVQLPGQAERALFTSIIFLLQHNNPSHFHRLTADEVWYFHYGSTLTVHMITPEGDYKTVQLGTQLDEGNLLQYTVPKGTIFGSTIEEKNGYGVVSCMVAPGFEYEDFELFTEDELLKEYPQHEAIIKKLAVKEK